jgi:hypothetical protein
LKHKRPWSLSARTLAVNLNRLQILVGAMFIAIRGLPIDYLEWLIVVIWFSVPVANLRVM